MTTEPKEGKMKLDHNESFYLKHYKIALEHSKWWHTRERIDKMALIMMIDELYRILLFHKTI